MNSVEKKMTRSDYYFRQGFIFPDQVVYTDKASLGEHRREKMKKSGGKNCQKENITQAVCALLNSGGGIALIESCDEDFNYSKDGLGQDLADSLCKLIYELSTLEYYDFCQEGSYLIIFVKPWGIQKIFPKLCTSDTGLYTRKLSSKKLADAMQLVDLIEKKTNGNGKRGRFSEVPTQRHILERLLAREYLCLDEKLEFGESNYFEFKDFSTEKCITRIKENIKIYFSAFGNSGGGCFIVGVNDKRKVKGCGRGFDRSDLEFPIKEVLKSMIFVHLGACNSEDEFYTLTIKDVGDDKCDAGYVIFLEVKPFCCLGFVQHPQSWILDSKHEDSLRDHLQAKQLTAPEWVKIMTNQDTEPSLESHFERLFLKEGPPMAKPVYGLETLQRLQNSLFGSIDDRLNIKPDKLYEDLKAEHPGLEDLLNTILPDSADSRAVLIVSRSWAVDVGQKSNPYVVCEILLLSPNNYPTLYSVFNAEVSKEEFDYSQSTAFTLKQKLVNIGSYTGKLCVIPAVLSLNAEHAKSGFPWPVVKYPETYKLGDLDTVKELLSSLSIVILSFRNMLSDKLGIEYFNLLTIEQYKVLSNHLYNQMLFVHGPPGTGKTVIALELMKRLQNRDRCLTDEILYICENKPLSQYVSSYNICQAMTRVKFVNETEVNVKHIVADEAQNFRAEEGDWFQKAKNIVKKSGGVFWVFLDNFQSYHKKDTGLPECNSQNRHLLTKVVRSPQLIHKKMLQQMKQLAAKANDPFLDEQIKRSECYHGKEGFYEMKILMWADIVKDVAQKCEHYFSKSYQQSDIAILCNTDNAVEIYAEPLYKEMKKLTMKTRVQVKRFIRAEYIKRDAIVLDTVRRFAGLERLIVFAINPVSEFHDVNLNLFVCVASRATGKLHVLYEK